MSTDRVQLRHLAEKGSRRARALSSMLEAPEWFLSTTLLGTNLCTVTLNVVATLWVVDTFGPRYGVFTVAVTAPLVLLVGEALPKALFQRYADVLSLKLVTPLRAVSWAIWPLVYLMTKAARGVAAVMGTPDARRTPVVTREELELLFKASERRSGWKNLEREMIDRIFSFSERKAREIMIPLVDVVCIKENSTLAEAAQVARESGFSRLPVYSGWSFNMVGWVNHFDLLLAEDTAVTVRSIMRKLLFVPANTRVDRMLLGLQRRAQSIAGVVDEYGGVIGIVTMEDNLEEVVGEIEDEYDPGQRYVLRRDADVIVVNARVPMERLEELLSTSLPEGDYETLSGFLSTRLQRIPAVNEEYRSGRIGFKVLRATEKRVEEVEIRVLKAGS